MKMDEKLTKEQLCQYLSHRVNVLYTGQDRFWLKNGDIAELLPSDIDRLCKESEFKLILFPLSSLTDEEYNFIWENETDYESIEQSVLLDTESLLCTKFTYRFWDELFKNHFDVFGLIEKGLAIDKNTIKK